MATETKQNWGQRSKKTSVVALGLVAILAGVAVAYFLTSSKFAGNRAVGGQLTVDATLPIDFTETALYPTNSNGAADYADQDFTVSNLNSVKVKYEIFATCEECIPNPADTAEQADARNKKIDQFNNLYISIQKSPAPTCGPETTITDQIPNATKCGTPIYQGKLADLSATAPAQLGEIAADGEQTYNVKLWLKNDATRAQPQAVENIWEFFINAKTPVG